MCTWLLTVSKGRLTAPSDAFVVDGQVMDEEFYQFHACKDRVDMKPRVLDRFTERLLPIFGDRYDRDVLQSFSTVRTTVRLRELNKELKNAERDQLGMRDYKQLGQLQTIRLSEVPNPYEEQARRALEEAGISY